MFKREGGSTMAGLPKGELAMPSVADGEGGEDVFVEKLVQTDGDVNFPDKWDMLNRVEAGREGSKHVR